MKCLEVTDEIFATMAGGAADCQFWIRNLSRQCRCVYKCFNQLVSLTHYSYSFFRLWELQNKEKMSVAAASKMLTNMLYNYKNMGLSVGTMIGGFDKTVVFFILSFLYTFLNLRNILGRLSLLS